MRRNFDRILAFLAVAQDGSFTKAASKLGMSQSTLSHTILKLEEQLDVRLLARTTRSVSLTQAGQRLFSVVSPRLAEIEEELDTLSQWRNKPSGIIRLTATEYAIETILWPKLVDFLPQYPGIQVELIVDYAMTNIVEQRYDAGVRIGGQLAQDMIAVRIGPDMRMAVVATPGYFKKYPLPKKPQDLMHHNCINLRLPTRGGLMVWEFKKNGHALNVHVAGQLVFNQTTQMLHAALAGLGLAYIPLDLAHPYIDAGQLSHALADWCPAFAGYHLYYPNRRHCSAAFLLLVEALRYRQ